MTTKNVLIINAHQFIEGISNGGLNNTMVGVIKDEMEKHGHAVRETHIERIYNSDADIEAEVAKHLWADIIILQSPVFWFGMPWIYKKYVDEVFTAGMFQQSFLSGDGRTRDDPHKQYGTGGKMQGKRYMLSLTWNAPREAFGDEAQVLFRGMTVDGKHPANPSINSRVRPRRLCPLKNHGGHSRWKSRSQVGASGITRRNSSRR